MGKRCIDDPPGGNTSRVPWMATATTGIGARGGGERAVEKSADLARSIEGALREEHQGLTAAASRNTRRTSMAPL